MSFWKGKPVLVTGANGFVGSNLTKKLISKEARVYTFGSSSSIDNPLLDKKTLGKVKKHGTGRIEDLSTIYNFIKDHHIKIIFHLAAQSLVEIGQESPIKTFEVNIQGTWNILEASRINRVDKVIIASTAHVYGNNNKVPYKEHYFPQPSRPYETSKACADLLAQSFADSYDLDVEIPRFVNIYGPGDFNFSRLIPKVIKAILKEEELKFWDEGTIRDFLFIRDVIEAYLSLAEKDLPRGRRVRIFNFGTGKPIAVSELIKKMTLLEKDIKVNIKVAPTPENRSNEVPIQYVSITKAKRDLGWRPKTSLDDGLIQTFNWYKINRNLI